MKTKEPGTNIISKICFPIVGIGALAGDFEAVKKFLQALPEKSGIAYVFVPDLNSAYETSLPDFPAKIPIHRITNNVQLEPDNFYIIPPNTIVTAIEGGLKLEAHVDKSHDIKVLDLFFASLGVIFQRYAVGVVLSGMLNDSLLGLEVINSFGGITIAQDEGSGTFDNIPKVVSRGKVNFVLLPEKIVEYLMTINYPFQASYSEKEMTNMAPHHLNRLQRRIVFQNEEKEKRAAELVIANKELLFQNQEKEKRAAELAVANKELVFQNKEKQKRAAELVIANKELVFQNHEKERRAAELVIANDELLFQNQEKEKRAAELVIANRELHFQNHEKQKRAAELVIANKELVFQNHEKEKRAAELIVTNEELELSLKNIEKSEERFRNVIEQSINPILILKGEDFILELANEPLFEVWGVGKEALGQPFLKILPEMQGQPFEKLLHDVFKNGNPHYGDEQPAHFVRKNGEVERVYFNHVYLPYRESDGSISGVMVHAYDVTAQVSARKKIEESEHLFRSMMETISQIAWTDAGEAEAVYFNQRWYDYTGLNNKETTIGHWYSVVHPDDLEEALEKFRLMRGGSEIGHMIEIRLQRKDGEYRWHLASMLPIKNEHSSIQRWVGTATDIHELKELQQKKDDFISIASHELKTPITTLKASIQLLNRMKHSSTSKMLPVLIEQANKSINKVQVLIEDLLNVNNFNDGQLLLNKTTFTISQMINDCCAHVRADKNYNIITEGEMKLLVYGDVGRVSQVIVNLVNNAVKYAPDSKEIHIKAEKINDTIKISVRDEGPGIPAKKLDHLFNRYYRADNSGHLYPGLGLGLYISSEIVKKHDGQIGVESELGKGSIFWFILPGAKQSLLP